MLEVGLVTLKISKNIPYLCASKIEQKVWKSDLKER